jgi:hypothetical protein
VARSISRGAAVHNVVFALLCLFAVLAYAGLIADLIEEAKDR